MTRKVAKAKISTASQPITCSGCRGNWSPFIRLPRRKSERFLSWKEQTWTRGAAAAVAAGSVAAEGVGGGGGCRRRRCGSMSMI